MSLPEFLVWNRDDDRLYELIEDESVPISDLPANHGDVADDICEQLKLHCQD
jgi:hypothetical protein